jgi:hypothetical protein
LSPDPASILHSVEKPKRSANNFEIVPMDSVEDFTFGSFSAKSGSMTEIRSVDQFCVAGFQSAVPDVSPGSITAIPPVKYQLI